MPASAIAHVSVVGSQTGAHAGRLLAYSQGNGASFVPARPFAEGERVVVRADLLSAGAVHPLLDVFAIAEQDAITRTPETDARGQLKRSAELSLAPGPAPAAGDRDERCARPGRRATSSSRRTPDRGRPAR